MDGEENEQMGVEEDCVCFNVENEYGGEEDEVIWPLRPEERHGEKIDAKEGGKQAWKGHTSKDLFQDLKEWTKLRQAGHCCCITTGDGSGNMAKNHKSHSSADSAD